MKKRCLYRAERLLHVVCLVLATTALAPVHAAPVLHRSAASHTDVVANFAALAQQRPWTCQEPASTRVSAPLPEDKVECAWQNRLRKHSWSWSDGASSCLSRQARWWNWAQARLPPATPPSVWDRSWVAQTLRFATGGEERLLLLERRGEGQWHATEWRWNPNPRPATRRWQEERWKLLVESTTRYPPRPAGSGQPDAARIQTVFRRVLGARPGELVPDGLILEAAGLCLRAGNPIPGQSKLPLSYSPNDSRLEQRAAMHLQLSRQHLNAKWLTQFKMLTMPANLSSGAKFLATWVEGKELTSQLWIPVKSDAATMRLRITTPLPRGQNDAAAMSKAKQVVERELEAIAVQWAAVYE